MYSTTKKTLLVPKVQQNLKDQREYLYLTELRKSLLNLKGQFHEKVGEIRVWDVSLGPN
jgi:hypothetical protein